MDANAPRLISISTLTVWRKTRPLIEIAITVPVLVAREDMFESRRSTRQRKRQTVNMADERHVDRHKGTE